MAEFYTKDGKFYKREANGRVVRLDEDDYIAQSTPLTQESIVESVMKHSKKPRAQVVKDIKKMASRPWNRPKAEEIGMPVDVEESPRKVPAPAVSEVDDTNVVDKIEGENEDEKTSNFRGEYEEYSDDIAEVMMKADAVAEQGGQKLRSEEGQRKHKIKVAKLIGHLVELAAFLHAAKEGIETDLPMHEMRTEQEIRDIERDIDHKRRILQDKVASLRKMGMIKREDKYRAEAKTERKEAREDVATRQAEAREETKERQRRAAKVKFSENLMKMLRKAWEDDEDSEDVARELQTLGLSEEDAEVFAGVDKTMWFDANPDWNKIQAEVDKITEQRFAAFEGGGGPATLKQTQADGRVAIFDEKTEKFLGYE